MNRRRRNLRAALPGIDCGSCGAPTCRAFAEDVIRGESKLEDCVILQQRKHQSEDDET